MTEEYEWEIVGEKNNPGTKSGWSVVKAASMNRTQVFDMGILIKSEFHDDSGGFLGPTDPRDYSISYLGVDYEEGEPVVGASSMTGDPLAEVDGLEDFVENEYDLFDRFVNFVRRAIPGGRMREHDLPAFDIAVEIEDSFYGVVVTSDRPDYSPRIYKLRASNTVETPSTANDIPDKEHREIIRELCRQYDGEERVEDAVEEFLGDYLKRNLDVEFENPMNPQTDEIW